MIWPVGQPDGKLYNWAMRSKMIWKDIADSINLWYGETGSLHLAYYEDEWQVLQELYDIFLQNDRPVQLMNKSIIAGKFNGINTEGLFGGLYSDTEMIIDPRDAIGRMAGYLSEYLEVKFIWGKAVTGVTTGTVYMGKETKLADIIFVCSGADFETLYPEEFYELEITRCKLQMMRFVSKELDFKIGTSICGGLSLIHYKSFASAPSLVNVKARFENEMGEYIKYGIHVMVSQNNEGELIVGDSHEYALTHSPFDSCAINKLITDYLKQFAVSYNWQLLETWNGIYPKMINADTNVFIQPDNDVYIVNGLGGAGMTLSFGFTEEMLKSF